MVGEVCDSLEAAGVWMGEVCATELGSVAEGIMVVEVCDAAVSSVIVVVSHKQPGDSAGGLVMW